MSTGNPASTGHGAPAGGMFVHRDEADKAYHRAWWSLALYPVSFAGAFAIGEGLYSALTDGAGDAAFWQVMVAGIPAMIVFIVPGVLAVWQGRKAMRLGRPEGRWPAIVGAVIGGGFVLQNAAAYVLGLLFG